MLGAVMATTKKYLAEIGGFESLVDYFCDDYELGNRLAAHGRRIKLSRFPVSIVYPSEPLPEAFRHQVRWNLSIRYFTSLGTSRHDFHAGLAVDRARRRLGAIAGHCRRVSCCVCASARSDGVGRRRVGNA